MAILSVLCGGVLGFFGFLTAWLAFDATLLTAMGIYMSVGLATALLLVLVALRPAGRVQTGFVQTAN